MGMWNVFVIAGFGFVIVNAAPANLQSKRYNVYKWYNPSNRGTTYKIVEGTYGNKPGEDYELVSGEDQIFGHVKKDSILMIIEKVNYTRDQTSEKIPSCEYQQFSHEKVQMILHGRDIFKRDIAGKTSVDTKEDEITDLLRALSRKEEREKESLSRIAQSLHELQHQMTNDAGLSTSSVGASPLSEDTILARVSEIGRQFRSGFVPKKDAAHCEEQLVIISKSNQDMKASLASNHQSMVLEIDAHRKRLAELSAIIASHDRDKNALKRTYEDKIDEVNISKDREIKELIRDHGTKIVALNSSIASKDQEIYDLKRAYSPSTIQQLKSTIKSKDQQLEGLKACREELGTIRTSHDDVISDLEETHKHKIEELESTMASKEEEINALKTAHKKRILELSSTIASKELQINSLSNSNSNNINTVHTLLLALINSKLDQSFEQNAQTTLHPSPTSPTQDIPTWGHVSSDATAIGTVLDKKLKDIAEKLTQLQLTLDARLNKDEKIIKRNEILATFDGVIKSIDSMTQQVQLSKDSKVSFAKKIVRKCNIFSSH